MLMQLPVFQALARILLIAVLRTVVAGSRAGGLNVQSVVVSFCRFDQGGGDNMDLLPEPSAGLSPRPATTKVGFFLGGGSLPGLLFDRG